MNERAKILIADYANDVFVSAVSVWEIAIKFGLGKRASAPPLSGEVALDGLPPLHWDPFDRMLIAQALSEPLRLLTADRALAAYGPMVMLEI